MARRDSRRRKPSLPHPAVDLDPLIDAFTASVRGAYLSGSRAMKVGKWKEARKHLTTGLVDASALEAQALSELIGATLVHDGEFKAALTRFEQLLEGARGRADLRGEARAIYNLGAARAHLGEYEAAEQLLQQARRLARSIPDNECRAFAEYGLAAVYRLVGRAKEAAELQSHAIGLALHDTGRALLLRLFIGPEGGFEGAEESVKQMVREKYVAAGRGDPVMDLQLEAERAEREGLIEEERTALHRMLNLARKMNRPKQEAGALRGLSSTYFRVGDHATSLAYLRQALDITRQHSTPAEVAFAMRVVAFAIAKTGDLDGAVGQIIEAYRLCQEHEDIERQRATASALVDLGVDYDICERLPEMCMEHGLSADEVRQLVDEAHQWIELYGYEGPPGPDDDEP
jgi:tetratricopeptide (TPR) repeat protein